MNILTLLLFLLGIVFMVMGYIEMFYNSKDEEKVIEYRFVPRNVYDSIGSDNLNDQFNFMFDATDTRNKTNLV